MARFSRTGIGGARRRHPPIRLWNDRAVEEPRTQQLLVDVRAGVARLTFDNPRRRNALTRAMAAAVRQALAALERDDEVRVVVLAGAGDQAFMSGADIGEQGDPATAAAFREESTAMMAALDAFPKPLLASIRGFCLGGGLTTALKADLRLAADDATFGVPAARLGVGYPYREVARLVAVAGPGAAADVLYTGRRLDAQEALRVGLVQRVWPADELDARVAEVAATIAANAPLSLRAAKAAIRAAQRDPAERRLDEVEQLIAACWASADYLEGRRAFAEKRPPRFEGR